MKKMIAAICAVVVLMSGIALTAYAANEYTAKVNFDYTQKKTYTMESSTGYKAKFEYNPGGTTTSANCSSRASVYLNAGQYGYAASTTTAQNGESVHRYWGGQATSAGYYYSPFAFVSGQKYAKNLYFYGDFRTAVNDISVIYKLYSN